MAFMTKVMAFGTFDILHPGHLFYLSQAKKLGNKLVVIVARGGNVRKFKGRKAVNDEMHRLQLVRALKVVDEAYLGEQKDIYLSVKKHRPNIIALGYDQGPKDKILKKELEKHGIKVRVKRIKAFKAHKHKTSKIKSRIKRHG